MGVPNHGIDMSERLPEALRSTVSGHDHSVGGALAFVGLVVVGLFAVSYPTVALGVGLGVFLGLGFPRASAALRRWTSPTPPTDRGRPRLSS